MAAAGLLLAACSAATAGSDAVPSASVGPDSSDVPAVREYVVDGIPVRSRTVQVSAGDAPSLVRINGYLYDEPRQVAQFCIDSELSEADPPGCAGFDLPRAEEVSDLQEVWDDDGRKWRLGNVSLTVSWPPDGEETLADASDWRDQVSLDVLRSGPARGLARDRSPVGASMCAADEDAGLCGAKAETSASELDAALRRVERLGSPAYVIDGWVADDAERVTVLLLVADERAIAAVVEAAGSRDLIEVIGWAEILEYG